MSLHHGSAFCREYVDIDCIEVTATCDFLDRIRHRHSDVTLVCELAMLLCTVVLFYMIDYG